MTNVALSSMRHVPSSAARFVAASSAVRLRATAWPMRLRLLVRFAACHTPSVATTRNHAFAGQLSDSARGTSA